MLSLRAHIDSLKFADQLATVKTLLDSAEVKKTFWGSRVVTIKGYTGSVYLESLAYKIVVASEKRSEADDLQPAERIAGIGIVRRLNHFYELSDKQMRCANCFTRFLNWIREYTCGFPYTTRFYLEETAESHFRAFSKEKFLNLYGGEINEWGNHSASSSSFGPPLRIVAKEERIRALLHPIG